MNPLVLFDYVYYSFAYLYANKWGYEAQKEYVGVLLLSLFQFINTITIFNFIKPLKEFLKFDPIFIYISLSLILIALNLIRYYKFVAYSELAKKWGKTRLLKIVCVISYLILSLCFFVYLVSYIKASIRN